MLTPDPDDRRCYADPTAPNSAPAPLGMASGREWRRRRRAEGYRRVQGDDTPPRGKWLRPFERVTAAAVAAVPSRARMYICQELREDTVSAELDCADIDVIGFVLSRCPSRRANRTLDGKIAGDLGRARPKSGLRVVHGLGTSCGDGGRVAVTVWPSEAILLTRNLVQSAIFT